MFDWRRNPNSGIRETLKRQKVNTKEEFDERLKQVSTEFAEQVRRDDRSWNVGII